MNCSSEGETDVGWAFLCDGRRIGGGRVGAVGGIRVFQAGTLLTLDRRSSEF